MTEANKKELTIAVVFLMLGFFICVPIAINSEKRVKLNQVYHEKALEIVWSKYEWKTKRLRVYTDIIYSNE